MRTPLRYASGVRLLWVHYKKKNTTRGGVSLFMVHLNRLANKKKLIIAFWSGVRQSKKSHEPKTCGGEVRRLCDSDVRTPGLTTSVLLKVSFRDSTRAANCAAWSFAGKTRPPEEFSTRLLLQVLSLLKSKEMESKDSISLLVKGLRKEYKIESG